VHAPSTTTPCTRPTKATATLEEEEEDPLGEAKGWLAPAAVRGEVRANVLEQWREAGAPDEAGPSQKLSASRSACTLPERELLAATEMMIFRKFFLLAFPVAVMGFMGPSSIAVAAAVCLPSSFSLSASSFFCTFPQKQNLAVAKRTFHFFPPGRLLWRAKSLTVERRFVN